MERKFVWKMKTFDPPQNHTEYMSLSFEVEFFEAALSRLPDNVEVLFALGHAYTRLGKYDSGLAIDRKLVELLPEDGTIRYNLACSYSLLGETDEALDELKRAIEFGYDDIEFLKSDPDLANVRHHPRFEQVISILENWETS